jgi:L-Ala-D/L-Glu epimerase
MISSRLRPPERPRVNVRAERFPFDRDLSRRRDAATVLYVEILDGTKRGRGEAVPDPTRGETIDAAIAMIEQLAPAVETGMLTRRNLMREQPPGAVRNALDLALWDFDAKRGETSVWQIAALDEPHRLLTAYRLDLDTPEAMAAAAVEQAHRPLLRLELGGETGALDRLQAVRAAVPRARLMADTDHGWSPVFLERVLPVLDAAGVELLFEPLPEANAGTLVGLRRPLPIAARCGGLDELERLAGRYDAVAIELDQAGGFTAALALAHAARDAGFKLAIEARAGSSLGAAPAVLLAQDAEWATLDTPLRLARDRQPGLRFDGSVVYPGSVSLWG